MMNMAWAQPYTVNNKLIVESYTKESLRATEKNGFARIDQKVALKGLKLLVNAKLNDGTVLNKGAVVYIREETLYTQQWASKTTECPGLFEGKCLIVDLVHVEMIDPAIKPGPQPDGTFIIQG